VDNTLGWNRLRAYRISLWCSWLVVLHAVAAPLCLLDVPQTFFEAYRLSGPGKPNPEACIL
jgi:hypothetical protein